MIRIDLTRQDTRHPDKRLRHQGRAWCEVDAVTLPLPCAINTEMFFQIWAENFGPLVERVFQFAGDNGCGAG